MMLPIEQRDLQNTAARRNALAIARFGLIASTVVAAFYLVLALRTGAWQIYALSLDVWALAAAALFAFNQILRDRVEQGVGVMLFAVYVTFVVGPLLIAGLGLVLGVSMALLVALIAGQTLQGARAERAILIGLALGVVDVLIDAFGGGYRLPVPRELLIGLSTVLVIALLVFGINFVRQFQQFRVATRLTALILLIAVPLVAAIVVALITRADQVIEAQANDELIDHTKTVTTTVDNWLELHGNAIHELASLPDIRSMDPARQRPALVAMANAYPNLFLVHTLDRNGINLARNDDEAPKDYHDRRWFQEAQAGAPFAAEVVISRTIGKPVLAMSTPIRDASGRIVGVAGIVTRLDKLSESVISTQLGASGYVFIVDEQYRLVAHPDPNFTGGDTLIDYSNYPSVGLMRQGQTGLVTFTDESGRQWRANLIRMDNGWGVIGQIPEAEFQAPLRQFQRISAVIATLGLSLLLALAWLSIQQTLRPVGSLTETVQAIAAGDLAREAVVSSEDEIGVLARSFNHMTARLRDLIANLEERVADRTAELESANTANSRRAAQFEAIALVVRAITSVRKMDELLPKITSVISEYFGYYHVGIFLNDEGNQFAIFSASNSEGGQRMLARGHQLKIGEQGIVGHVAATGEPRLARNVGEDAAYFSNPDLPETQSETALPLRVAGQVVGVLDVQSRQPDAFTPEDMRVLGLLADQVSLAIDNVRLFETTRRSLSEAEALYRQYLRQAWSRLPREQQLTGFRYSVTGAFPLDKPISLDETAEENPQTTKAYAKPLVVPIKLRGETIGNLIVQDPQIRKWTQDDIDLAQAVAERVALSVENARLFDETSRRAERERLVTEITSKIRGTNDPEAMIQTALDELRNALGASQVQLVPHTASRQTAMLVDPATIATSGKPRSNGEKK